MRDFADLHAGAWLQQLTSRAGLAVLFAAALAFLGPFGTSRFGPMDRVGYWTVLMVAWLVLSQSALWLLSHAPGRRRPVSVRLQVVATVAATVPMIIVISVANNMMNGWQPNVADVVEIFISILMIGGAYTYLSDRIGTTRAHAPETARADALPDEAPFTLGQEYANDSQEISNSGLIGRLPPHIRGDILCLQVEDHYVRVHSSVASAMVLIRFSDALRGVSHLSGSQVHRSWWVADEAVTAIRRSGRTAQLTLKNGASVPVSQPYLAHALRSWGEVELRVG